MRSNRVLATLTSFVSCSLLAQSDSCLVPASAFDNNVLLSENKIRVQADRAEIKQDTVAEFAGKVAITSNTAQIQAKRARIDKQSKELKADGGVKYLDPQIQVDSDDVTLNTETNKLTMNTTHYRMMQFQGRGVAEQIDLSKEQGIKLQDVSFSTCPAGAEDWVLKADSIELKPGQIWGEARGTGFYVKGVPVLYLPYFSFPVTDDRQSGLLIPEISSTNRTGVTYEQPIYWNIAPNFDATFSPRIMSDRGIQLKTEFRYLTERHGGTVNVEYLPNDTGSGNRKKRYFYRFAHTSYLADNWQLKGELNGLSDDNYIVDLGSDYYNRADTHLFRTLGLSYHGDDLDMQVNLRDFEVIGDHPDSYRTLPEIRLNYEKPINEHLEFSVDSELTYFDNGEAQVPSASRLHIAPSVRLPYATQWTELEAQATLLQTFYHQEDVANTPLKEDVNRTIGQLRLYGSMAFERDSIVFGEGSKQTLEPKFQYLYTSFENQDDIGLYDTIQLRNDFEGLFRGQEFSGLDRISDQNQLTVGVTTRLLDKNNREHLKLSVGQTFFFERSKVQEIDREDDRSTIAAELDWRISSKWSVKSEVQVSSGSDQLERSSVALDYRLSNDRLVQFNHRYVRDLSGERIDQLGLVTSWPIAKNWQWVGRYYRDFERNRSTESYAGIQYESCCWAMQLVWSRHLTNRFDALGFQSENEYDSGFSFKFVFKGMSDTKATRKLLNDGLFGYRQPYLLNN